MVVCRYIDTYLNCFRKRQRDGYTSAIIIAGMISAGQIYEISEEKQQVNKVYGLNAQAGIPGPE